MKGICPRGNNKVVIILFHVYDKCFISHARIVLIRNINTCVTNEQIRVPSNASRLTSSLIN